MVFDAFRPKFLNFSQRMAGVGEASSREVCEF